MNARSMSIAHSRRSLPPVFTTAWLLRSDVWPAGKRFCLPATLPATNNERSDPACLAYHLVAQYRPCIAARIGAAPYLM